MEFYKSDKYEVGDIVFTTIGTRLFGQISEASQCWCNHVGIIIGHDGSDYLVAESRVPLSTTTTLTRFIARSACHRFAIKRLKGGLDESQKKRLLSKSPPDYINFIILALITTLPANFAQNLCLIFINKPYR